jgi:protoheme IX farnesyltransferase
VTTATAPAPHRAKPYQEPAATELALQPRSAALPWSAVCARLSDYAELTKPRIAAMVLITVTVGYTLATHGQWQWGVLLPALLGVALVASASSAFNQWYERRTDARMDRTANRPLPAGRLTSAEVLLFGAVCAIAGGVTLAVLVNVATAALTLLTLVLYAGVYTPLKRHTSLCTAIGAVPGALPPVLGWTAGGGGADLGALTLFAILFLWQFPHFLAIAWLYRHQYDAAQLKMLPRNRQTRIVGLLAVTYAVALIPASLLPGAAMLAGDLYLAAAAGLGLMYLAAAIRFAWQETRASARGLLFASLIYLPALLLTLTLDHLRLLM